MLLDFGVARNIAEQQALAGLELAYAANEAHTQYANATRERDAAIEQAIDLPVLEYSRVMDETRPAVAANALNFEALADAAGALIGRNTLGGDYISVQNRNEP
jgi:hypothetical protein